MSRIGMDFDGTIAVWPKGTKPTYNDPYHAMANAAALPAAVKWIKHQINAGHQITIITGRGQNHQRALERWIHIFIGKEIEIHCRPSAVGLQCIQQANWKAHVLKHLEIEHYIGDNSRIDEKAAKTACIPYIDAACFLQGGLPTLEETAK